MNPQKSALLSKMRVHQPIPTSQVGMKCALRWATVGALALMLPLGALMAHQGAHPWDYSGSMAVMLAMLGFWGVGVGWLELRQQGLEKQWGLSPLSSVQCQELQDVVAPYPELEVEVDEWLSRWVDTGSQLRGRDLVFLRKCVREWEALLRQGHSVPTGFRKSSSVTVTETE